MIPTDTRYLDWPNPRALQDCGWDVRPRARDLETSPTLSRGESPWNEPVAAPHPSTVLASRTSTRGSKCLSAYLDVRPEHVEESLPYWKIQLDVQVQETRPRVLWAEHIATLTSIGNFTWTYRVRGRWKEAGGAPPPLSTVVASGTSTRAPQGSLIYLDVRSKSPWGESLSLETEAPLPPSIVLALVCQCRLPHACQRI